MTTPRLLEDKIAFVTGGAQGLGLSVAHRFFEAGARVVIGDVNATGAAQAAASLEGSGKRSLGVGMDVADEESTQAALTACVEHFGRVDIVVANAGVLHLGHVLDTSEAQWRRVIDVNLTGAFLTCKHFGRQLVEQGSGGRIILTSSLFGRRGGVENGAYSASKFGMIGLVESLAAELAPHRVCVNAVCPGQIETEMIRSLFAQRASLTGKTEAAVEGALVGRIPMGRMGQPSEIADAFLFLASDLSSYMTGQSVVVDGGWFVG